MNPTGQNHRRPIAIAKPAREDAGFTEIVILSLAGLTCALFEIAHYIGTDALRQMFAQ